MVLVNLTSEPRPNLIPTNVWVIRWVGGWVITIISFILVFTLNSTISDIETSHSGSVLSQPHILLSVVMAMYDVSAHYIVLAVFLRFHRWYKPVAAALLGFMLCWGFTWAEPRLGHVVFVLGWSPDVCVFGGLVRRQHVLHCSHVCVACKTDTVWGADVAVLRNVKLKTNEEVKCLQLTLDWSMLYTWSALLQLFWSVFAFRHCLLWLHVWKVNTGEEWWR